MSTKEHLVVVSSTIGPITIIETRRKNRPAGLRKPYEYVLPVAEAKALTDELRALLKDSYSKGFDCSLVERKGLSRGIRLHFFLQGYCPGLHSGTGGVTQALWEGTVRDLQALFTKHLGEDAHIYDEPYSTEQKFQACFETYIMFREMA